jgi:tetratricopeptide (TPR) repeat protein
LQQYGLVEQNGQGRLMLHQLIADYARLRASDTAARERMSNYFVQYLVAHQYEFEKCDLEFKNLVAALENAYNQERNELLLQGVNAFCDYCFTRGLYDLIKTHLARARESSSAGVTIREQIEVWQNLGRLSLNYGNYDEAEHLFRQGIELANSDGPEQLARLLQGVAVAFDHRATMRRQRNYIGRAWFMCGRPVIVLKKLHC